jgi:small subunit ribosomal protein S20
MPHSRSSKKRVRQNEKRRLANRVVVGAMRTAEKAVLSLLAEGKAQDAEKALPYAFQRLDKAAKRHVIHRNTAANHKSKLARRVASALAKKA